MTVTISVNGNRFGCDVERISFVDIVGLANLTLPAVVAYENRARVVNATLGCPDDLYLVNGMEFMVIEIAELRERYARMGIDQ